MAKRVGRPRKAGRPKGGSKKDSPLKDIIHAQKSELETLKNSLKIYQQFEGMLVILHDKVKILQEEVLKKKEKHV